MFPDEGKYPPKRIKKPANVPQDPFPIEHRIAAGAILTPFWALPFCALFGLGPAALIAGAIVSFVCALSYRAGGNP